MKQGRKNQNGKRLNIVLRERFQKALEYLTEKHGDTATAVISEALERQAFMEKSQEQGSELYLHHLDGSMERIIFL